MNKIQNITFIVLAILLAIAVIKELYFSAVLIVIFAVVLNKYITNNEFMKYLNRFF